MTIQTIAMVNTNNFGASQQNAFSTLFDNIQNKVEPLTPEQKNTLQEDFNDKIAEQANNIKSNFQTAKDLDLTRAYYEQQQKLVDIYMQAGTETGSNNNSSISATKTLIDGYASLYHLHQTIKEGVQQFPSDSGIIPLPESAPKISRAEATLALTDKQIDTYNSFMMPTTNSYLSLQA